MKVLAETHCGNVRENNEDRYLIPEDGDDIVLVADGMGGYKAGEVASDMASQTILSCSKKVKGREISIKTAVKWVREANRGIYLSANQNAEYSGMGTTLTFLYFMKKRAILAHVGDSRCYRIRNRQILQLTKDHSLVAELVRMGEITKEQARFHPYKNVITRAVGTDAEVAVDALDIEIEKDDIYVLCTDGLTNYLEDEELLDIVNSTPADVLCSKLISVALERGGKDNITVVVAFCNGEEAAR